MSVDMWKADEIGGMKDTGGGGDNDDEGDDDDNYDSLVDVLPARPAGTRESGGALRQRSAVERIVPAPRLGKLVGVESGVERLIPGKATRDKGQRASNNTRHLEGPEGP
jgi:hypothetical protein